ncbi:MAG: type II toxin-antitoxin system PemK/MazF family toxin [Nitrospirae bacterium]|nr:type II toxin-antitoxin system PemK/MazF family toxin [Nitrospirota bacterium]
MLRQRDIVLIPIPFTDLTSQKKRPAVIISSDNYNDSNEDIVVVALTSNVEPRKFSVALTNDELEEGALKVASMIRVDKIYTLNKSIVIKTFGRVKPDILTKIKNSLSTLTEVHATP